jgi:peptidoglycan/xylan/chitin deacetylase (PgdA/CDA1 family)
MLAYRNILLLLLICSLLIVGAGWIFDFLNIWLILMLLVANIIAVFSASLCICSGFYIKAFCSGTTKQKHLSLSFDDGPDAEQTPKVLDLLKEKNIKAVFFLVGRNIEGNEHLLKRMVDEGHSIGNHSYAHVNSFGFQSFRAVKEDLQKSQQIIEEACGRKVVLFRPPFGVTNPNIAKAARLLNYIVVGWSIRSLDTTGVAPAKTIKRVSKRLKPGELILLHDNHKRIIPILEGIIEKAEKDNYNFVSLEELLKINTE